MELQQIIEALLIASPEPLTPRELAGVLRTAAKRARDEEAEKAEEEGRGRSGEAPVEGSGGSAAEQEAGIGDRPELAFLEVTPEQVEGALEALAAEYAGSSRAFALLERAEGWKLFTRGEFAPWVRHLFPEKKPERLSAPALETLAIVAYRQPITKSAIEAVRGVSVDGVLQKLLDRNIVRIAGRAELPGRPLLYETTDLFFEHFGIRSVDDLPNASELRTVKLPEPEPPAGSEGGEESSDPGEGDAAAPAEAEASEPVAETAPDGGSEDPEGAAASREEAAVSASDPDSEERSPDATA